MGSIKKVLFFIARLFLSAIFLIAGFAHIADFDGMQSSLTNSLYSLSEHSHGQLWLQVAVEELIPLVPVLATVAVALLVIGGICVLLGIKYRLGASLLILFLLPTTLIMHHFYFLSGPDQQLQSVLFWKNIAILGGLLGLALYPNPMQKSSDEDF